MPSPECQEMLAEMEKAVLEGDTDQFAAMVNEQAHIRPFELAEYIDVKRRRSPNEENRKLWRQSLDVYLGSLDGEAMPVLESDVIKGIIRDLEFEDIMSNKTVAADSFTVEKPSDIEQDPDGWFTDHFTIELDASIVRNTESTEVFERAKRCILGDVRDVPLEKRVATARQIIINSLEGVGQTLALKVLDAYIFDHATRQAQGGFGKIPAESRMDYAFQSIRQASDKRAVFRMMSAMDKEVYRYAKLCRQGLIPSVPLNATHSKAKRIVMTYASSPERKVAILKSLELV